AAHVKDLVCCFRLADNPHDELAWFRVLQLLDGVGPATARRAIDALRLGDPGAARWADARAVLPRTAVERADALAAARAPVEGEAVVTHAERIRDALAPLIEQHYEDGAARLTDLAALVDAARHAARLSDVATDLMLE